MRLTTEDFNSIKEYEQYFSHAINEGYFRIINRGLLKVYAEIYKRVFNKDSKIMNGCSLCVLNNIKELAAVYFQDKKELETTAKAETAEKQAVAEAPAKQTPKTAKKKPTTKNKKK